MARNRKFRAEQVELALRMTAGIYTAAAEKLGCATNTVRNYVLRSKRLQEVVRDVQETTLDVAESTLLTAMQKGNLTAAIFYLKTKGKHRGYVERVEQTGKNGGPIPVANVDVPSLSDEQLDRLARGDLSCLAGEGGAGAPKAGERALFDPRLHPQGDAKVAAPESPAAPDGDDREGGA
jgi:hypothetical protein